MMEWVDYDPEWLVSLAREQLPEEAWLLDALGDCNKVVKGHGAYVRFVSSGLANQPGSEWQFERNLTLIHEDEGMVVLDVLEGLRIGGVEFIDQLR